MLIEKGLLKGARPATAVLLVAYLAICSISTSAARQRSAPAQPAKRETTLSVEARTRVRQAIAAVGSILVRSMAGDSTNQNLRIKGSAVVVRADGVVVTNNHVIVDEKTRRIHEEIYFDPSSEAEKTGANRYRLKALLINKEYDLALLQIDSDAAGSPVDGSVVFPAIELADSKAVQLLDDLIIIGYPREGGSTITLSKGVVEGKDILGNWIKTDGRMIHGNSGGAAVNTEGKLVGIPTKVFADRQPIDKNGDGFPDEYRLYGAVGFLRPAHLVQDMLAELGGQRGIPPEPAMAGPREMPAPSSGVTVRGIVKSAASGKPIAGALVGLLQLGSKTVTESNLLTWGGTNSDGQFVLNKPVPPGRYTVRAKAMGHDMFTAEVAIEEKAQQLVIQMRTVTAR